MNYLSYISDDELEMMLSTMGYKLVEIENRDGDLMPKIERTMNEHNKETIMVRCKDVEIEKKQTEMNSLIAGTTLGKSFSMLKSMTRNFVSPEIGFIILSDFEFMPCFMDDIFATDKPKENQSFIFANLFKERLSEKSESLARNYVKEYNLHAKKHNTNLAKQQKQEQKQQKANKKDSDRSF